MQTLAGTKWGANSKILKQLYTGAVRPVMEYGSSAWATAAETNTNRLTKVQNAGMRMIRIITGRMKSTPRHCHGRVHRTTTSGSETGGQHPDTLRKVEAIANPSSLSAPASTNQVPVEKEQFQPPGQRVMAYPP